VLSTLHTNDAPGTLVRLQNMGVAPFNVASSVILITAQRLARKLCACKQPAEVKKDALVTAGFRGEDLDGNWIPYKPVGCDKCKGSGYKGRLGIYQVMPITETMQDMILRLATAPEISREAAANGVRDLRQSGLLKVKAGITSIDEVLGCTNE
jgi:type IV pilus assembly protein PilB